MPLCSRVSPEALTKQIRHLDEDGAAVGTEVEPWFELACERVESVVVDVVVVADVKGGTRIRRPAEKVLPADPRTQRIVINPRPDKRKAGELILRKEGPDIAHIDRAFRVIAGEGIPVIL